MQSSIQGAEDSELSEKVPSLGGTTDPGGETGISHYKPSVIGAMTKAVQRAAGMSRVVRLALPEACGKFQGGDGF